jgi:hypothetical protein
MLPLMITLIITALARIVIIMVTTKATAKGKHTSRLAQ